MASEDLSSSSSSSKVHATGLGVMPSMSSECTPLKHRYDACFNSWFEEYLALPPVASSSSSSMSTASEATNDSGVSGFFSSSKKGTSGGGSGPSPSERKRLRERLEGDCGAFWKEYQSCVLKAVKEKDLEELIQEARIQNPFPFPHDRKNSSASNKNNDPFPFPAQDTPSSTS